MIRWIAAAITFAICATFALAQTLPIGPGAGVVGPSGSGPVGQLPHFGPAVISVDGQMVSSDGMTSLANAYGGAGPTGLSGYGTTSVTIYWTTDQASDSTVNYGTTTGYGSTAHSSTLVKGHNVVLTGLTPDTDYHYTVFSQAFTGTSIPTPDAVFTTQGSATLKSLIYAGGHIGLQNQDQFAGANYVNDNVPADVIYSAEFNSTVAGNDCKWQFTANATGTVNEMGPGTGCYNSLVTRFPTLGYRFHNVMWFSKNPPSMTISPSTWQADIAFRVSGTGGIGQTFSNGGSFFSIDVCNECWASGGGSGPNAGGAWSTAGGASFWQQPFLDLAALPTPDYRTTRLAVNQYSFGENSSEWGGDPSPFFCNAPSGVCKMAAQPTNKVNFDYGLEQTQNYLIAGGRVDGANYEMHLMPNYIISENDLKYQLWDWRRLGITPELTETNISAVTQFGFAQGTNSAMDQFSANYTVLLVRDFIIYGGVKDFMFWANTPNNGVGPWLTLYLGNQKTFMYRTLAALFQDSTIVPATSFPRVRRLGFHDSLPYAGTTANQPINCVSSPPTSTGSCGTQGLITIPWTEYVYRVNNGDGTYGAVTTFSQTAWTIDLQFYTLGNANGNLFEAVDASSNPLVTVNRNSSGATTVAIGGGSPVSVGTSATNSYHGLAITKNGTNWQFSMDGGAVATTTGSIASVANLEWLDNSGIGSPTTDAALATIDVYESQSAVTNNTALQALSVFANSHVLGGSDINNFVP